MRASQRTISWVATAAVVIAVTAATVKIVAPSAVANESKARTFRLLKLENRTVAWAMPTDGSARTLTWAIARRPSREAGARNCGLIVPPTKTLGQTGLSSAGFERLVASAFAAWANIGVFRFERVNDPQRANILIGEQARPRGIAYANVTLSGAPRSEPRHGPQALRRARVCLNGKAPWKVGFDGDLQRYDLTYVLMHEIGHALGLDHPGASGQVMSWRYEERFATLQPGDISGLKLLYGRGARSPVTCRAAAPAARPSLGIARRKRSAPPRR